MNGYRHEADKVGSVVDPRPGKAVYKQLADELRRQIGGGGREPGAPLPSETSLMNHYGVSRNTVRLAVSLLRSEGLVVTEHGRGSYVRPHLPVRRISASRYRTESELARAGGDPVTSVPRAQDTPRSDHQVGREYREVPASEHLADLLRVSPGTPLLERRFTFSTSRTPEQLSVSYHPLGMVAGTPLADPENESWPGENIAQFATLGIHVTTVEESVRTRMPMPDEATLLRISHGTPVFSITRRMLAGERPVEAAVEIVIPGDRAVLEYRIDLE